MKKALSRLPFAAVMIAIGLLLLGGCSSADLNKPYKASDASAVKKGPDESSLITMTAPPASVTGIYWKDYSTSSYYPGSATGSIGAGQDVWFRLDGLNPSDGMGQSLVITLGTLPDSYMYLYLQRTDPATGVKTLTLVTSDDDGGVGLASKIDFPYKDVRDYSNSGSFGQNVCYLVRVTGYSASQSGSFTITRYVYDCDAVRNGGAAYPDSYTFNGTPPSGDVGAPIAPGGSVWYKLGVGSGTWNGGNWTIKTFLTTLPDSVLEIWDVGPNYPVPTRIAMNDDYGGTLASLISMNFTSNPCYMIKVRAYSKYQSGKFMIAVKNN